MSGKGLKAKNILSRTWAPAQPPHHYTVDFAPWMCAGAARHWRAQHPARAWEYALALTALDCHGDVSGARRERLVLDVGGAGSPLAWIVAERRGLPVQIIDPEFNGLTVGRRPVAETDGYNSWVGDCHASVCGLRGKADLITCISVIEHVEDEQSFLLNIVALLAPGGVLFLTTDYVDELGPEGDVHQFHWMRRRIYTRKSWFEAWDSVYGKLLNLNCEEFGTRDKTYHGPIHDLGYSFASLCVRKEG